MVYSNRVCYYILNLPLSLGKGPKLILFVFTLIFFVSYPETAQGNLPMQADSTSTDTTSTYAPYSTDKSLGYHILAFPSYLLHWTTRPIGYGIKLAERELLSLLKGKRGPVGIYPLFEVGGDTPFAFGALIFHKNVFNLSHEVRLESLFGSVNYNDFDFEYTIPGFITDNGQLELEASYSNDPIKSFYGGNASLVSNERLYSTEQVGGSLTFSHPLSKTTRIQFNSGYRRLSIGESTEEVNNQGTISYPPAYRTTTSLYSVKSSVQFNFAKGTPRIHTGSRFKMDLAWKHSLHRDKYNYLKYRFEWNTFLPLFLLPDNRRLAFKSTLEKTAPLYDKNVPFFDNPSLGSSYDLRGFNTNRFRDDGSLLFTLEYRYPMWNFADIVFFIDEGQVFNDYTDIHLEDFHTSYGFGFHFISTNGFAFRSEFAFSRNASRVILNINPNF